jgi:flagellar biosynthetic protein FliO
MMIVLKKLIIFALFLMPAYGQSAETPSQNVKNIEAANSINMVGHSAAQSQPNLVEETQQTSMDFPVFRTMGGLGLVVCLMIGAYFAAKKFLPQYFSKNPLGKNLKIIETLAMGDKRSISLIEVGRNRFLVGNTPHQINLLTTLNESISLVSEQEPVSAPSNDAVKRESKAPFRNLFEMEKKRSTQYTGNSLPDDVRTKMRQLSEALER